MKKIVNRIRLDIICYKRLYPIIRKDLNLKIGGEYVYISGLHFRDVLLAFLTFNRIFKFHLFFSIYSFFSLALWGERTCFLLKSSKNNTVIGGFWLYMNEWDLHHNTIHLGAYFVSNIYRGKHIGKLLVSNVIEELVTNRHIKGISAKVNMQNKASLMLLQSMGFKYVDNNLCDLREGEIFLIYIF